MDSDGYPELMVVLNKGKLKKTSFATLYEKDGDSFSEVTSDFYDDIRELENVISAAFFDIDENGDLDILVTTEEGGTAYIHSFYNNFLTDAFHLKAQALNGKHSYSSAYPGATFKFIVMDPDMDVQDFYAT
jgi:hypothetical protein